MLCSVITELTEQPYNWNLDNIHLFGFGQGGTLAAETGQAISRRYKGHQPDTGQPAPALGSVVSVGGPLLSLPTTSTLKGASSKLGTRLLYVVRQTAPASTGKLASQEEAFKRAYSRVELARLPLQRGQPPVSMPRSKDEWEPIMRFWSEVLRRRSAWELDGSDIYEVTGGGSRVSVPQRSGSATQATSAQGQENSPAEKPVKDTMAAEPKKQPTARTSGGLKRGFLSKGFT